MSAALWPPPRNVRPLRRGVLAAKPEGREYALVPGACDPHLIIPVGSRAATARLVRRWGAEGSRQRRAYGMSLAAALLLLGPRVLRDRLRIDIPAGCPPGLEEHLGVVLGRRGVSLSVSITRPRANRKPVLQVIDPSGTPVAFVKVGTDPFTHSLVDREARALDTIRAASPRSPSSPTVLHYGTWEDLALLALAPEPLWRARRPRDIPVAAMRELARMTGTARHPLATSSYRTRLGERVHRVRGEHGAVLRDVLRRVDRTFGDGSLEFGSWHGDWAAWNCADVDGRLVLWDWERFAQDTPVGYDAVHYRLHQEVLDPAADTRAIVANSPRTVDPLLAAMGVVAVDRPVTTVLYLVEIATRYILDGQEEIGALRSLLGGFVAGTLDAARTLGR